MIHHEDERITLHHGDCLDVLQSLPDASVDAVVTDPPYGLGFMGKEWDKPGQATRQTTTSVALTANPYSAGKAEYGGASYGGNYLAAIRNFQDWCELWSAECLRVLKPGGHMLAFGGTRTFHRLTCAVEDAGFEIRDGIAWLYGSGFPKSLDVSKAIDKAAGGEREAVGLHPSPATPRAGTFNASFGLAQITAPATPDAEHWQGWGTALKPAFEPIVVARKPLVGTVAANVLAHGTGALNVDGCRIEAEPTTRLTPPVPRASTDDWRIKPGTGMPNDSGRWPANVILDDSQAAELDEQSGEGRSRIGKPRGADSGDGWGMTATGAEYDDTGGASRFFYTAKASADERVRVNGTAHPTVKPLALMRWLVRLVTPPGGIVLEPFAGSGTTVEACILEGFRCIAIEREADYLPLIVQRIARGYAPPVEERTTVKAVMDAAADQMEFGALLEGEAAS